MAQCAKCQFGNVSRFRAGVPEAEKEIHYAIHRHHHQFNGTRFIVFFFLFVSLTKLNKMQQLRVCVCVFFRSVFL